MTNTTLRADVATTSRTARSVRRVHGRQPGSGSTPRSGQWNPPAGPGSPPRSTTLMLEQLGYEVGTRDLHRVPGVRRSSYYSVQFKQLVARDRHIRTHRTVADELRSDPRVQFMFGVMRAHTATNATWGHSMDRPFLLPGSPGLGCDLARPRSNGTRKAPSPASPTTLPAATWNHIAPLFHIAPFSLGRYGQLPRSTRTARNPNRHGRTTKRSTVSGRWVVGGANTPSEAMGAGLVEPPPVVCVRGPEQLLVPDRAASPGCTAAPSTPPGRTRRPRRPCPRRKSGSGTTRTLSGTASHAFGIRCVKAYIYPSGTPVYAKMTCNLGARHRRPPV